MEIVKTCLRWSHRVFWYSLAGFIITLAIVISLTRIFLPDVKVYREQVEHIASTFLGQEVHIRSMDARLSGFTPMIIFRGVSMLDDTGKHEIMRFAEARLGLDWWHSLTERKIIPASFTLYGVKLAITRRKDKTLVLQGLNLSKFEKQINTEPSTVDTESNELARWLFQRSLLSLKHSTVVWHDALRGNKTMRFDDVNVDIHNDGDRHQFTGTVSLPLTMGNELAVAFDFKGNILNPAQWQGRFYVRGRGLKIQQWGIKPAILHSTLENGMLDLVMWGQWQAGKVTALTSDIRVNKFRLNLGSNKKSLAIKFLSAQFDWQSQPDGWRLNVQNLRYTGKDNIWPRTTMQLVYHNDGEHPGSIDGYSSYLQLADTSDLLQKLQILGKPTQQLLQRLSPQGELSNLHVHFQLGDKPDRALLLTTRFKGLTLHAYKSFPGVGDLDGELWTTQQHGEARFADSSLQLSLPRLFRKPFDITRLQGAVQWWHAYDAWHVLAPQLAFDSLDVQTQVAVNLSLPDNKASPFLDLQAHFANGNAKQTSHYLPVGIMDKKLVDWLDHGIVDGHINSGDALFHGRLADFPFTHHPGTFVVDFQAEKVQLDYRKGWPKIRTQHLLAHFTGKGMNITATGGGLYHTRLPLIKVSIADFRIPVLTVDGQFSGDVNDAVRFLVNSPIAPGAAGFYKQSQIGGKLNGRLNLSVPLSKQAVQTNPTSYQGYLQFQNASLQSWHKRLEVNKISGRLNFSQEGINSENLTARFSGQPTQFKIYTNHVDTHQIINIGMKGSLDMAALRGKLPLNGIDKLITGKGPWTGLLRFGSEDPAHPKQVSLNIDVPLKGIGLKFPPPMNKPADAQEDLHMDMRFADNDTIPLDIKLGKRLNAALLLRAPSQQALKIEKGTIEFSNKAAVLPPNNQLVIRGKILNFPLDAWQAIRKQLAVTANVSNLNKLDLPLMLDMDYLNVTTKADAPQGAAEDPRHVPLFSGDIRELIYNGRHLGHLVLKTSRESNGIHFNKISLNSPYLSASGEGSWFVRQGKQHTNILLTMKTDNVGSLISYIGYKGVIKNGKAHAVVQLNWPNAPNHFSLAKLNGTLGMIINDGRITDVEPGAGRLVGLLSLSELPRHLALDFSDFRKGMDFKQILAQFDIVDGDAFTKNLHIISPIALIDINGRTGLAKRDYDLNVSVAPNVSKTLPVISWLAWGGQVGALTFLMDQLFGHKFNESIASNYRVTGTWEKPIVKQIPLSKPQTKDTLP